MRAATDLEYRAAASCLETHRSALTLVALQRSASRCDAPRHEAGRDQAGPHSRLREIT